MGTSLSGLTPATTFDGLLKVGDNDPLTSELKAISTGDGTDTMLELSTTALQIGGDTGMYWDNTNKRLGIGTDAPSVPFEVYGNVRFRNALNVNDKIYNSSSGIVNIDSLAYFNGVTDKVGIGENTPTARLHVKVGTTQDTIARFQDPLNASSYVDIKNDSTLTDYTGIYWGNKAKIRSKQAGTIFIDTSVGVVFADGNASKTKIYTNGSMSIGASTIPSSTMTYIKGSGTTSATTSLLVQNSNGDDMMVLDDSKEVSFNGRSGFYNGVFIVENNHTKTQGNAIIGAFATPTARLQVKGSGNDNTTTSLLVQNSAITPTDLFKIDDAGTITAQFEGQAAVGLNISGLGSNTTEIRAGVTTSFASSNIKAEGSIRLAYGTVNKYVTVGADGDLGSRLGIKGSGATSATTSLLVQNSAGTRLMEVQDGGNIFFGAGTSNYLQNGYNLFGNYNAIGSWNIGTASAMGARVGIKGSGNDATTTALLVQNSDGAELLKVDDSGATDITANITNAVLGSFRNTDSNGFGIELRAGNALSRYSMQWERYNGGGGGRLYPDGVMIGDQVAPTARLQVKGSGATSATTALLVQNSAGTDMLRIMDGGADKVLRTSSAQIGSLEFVGANIGRGGGSPITFAGTNQIGMGVSTPDASAKLQIDSTTQGFLPPRMRTGEKNAITSPAPGLMVYDTDANQMSYWNGGGWINF